jgi:hypothetical protein
VTIEVKLTPELESRLASEAEARGLSLEQVTLLILREALASACTRTSDLTTEDLHAMLKALAEGSERLPVLATETFRRVSFYE